MLSVETVVFAEASVDFTRKWYAVLGVKPERSIECDVARVLEVVDEP